MGLQGRMFSCFRTAVMGASLLAASVVHAQPAEPSVPVALQAVVALQASGDLQAFYYHAQQPLWVTAEGAFRPATQQLLQLLRTADYDGLDPIQLRAGEIAAAVQLAEQTRDQADLARAELALTTGLVSYVEGMSRQSASAMIYEHDILRPIAPAAPHVLYYAAHAPSLEDYVTSMPWMHPLYAQIRQNTIALAAPASLQPAVQATLQRVRDIPAPQWGRHVVIDIVSARLWMYEDGRAVDSMKVVVGKLDTQTPQMAGYLRYAVLKPYWNVPENLVQKTIAPNVVRMGIGYLRTRGYEVLSDWTENAQLLDPTTIDWRAVASGSQTVRVRQKPGGANSMGEVKFEFPNPQGIYLHDTPEKQYMLRDVRQLSNGCVRLEDAQRFGRWLLGGAMPQAGQAPEQRVDLQQPVPLYITYLTVQPVENQLNSGRDPYGLDGAALSDLARLD